MITTYNEDDDEKTTYFSVAEADFCKDYSIEELVNAAYVWQGDHHRIWWIEQIAARLGILLEEGWDRGIPP